jgi:HEAT repeat protein
VAVRKHCGTAEPHYEVEFRDASAGTIPLLIKGLEDKDKNVRLEAVEVIGKSVNYGEWELDGITAQLTRIIKSSFVKPS